jgi:DMSO/TMAO reductase YedYZ molybdopterin-dependent catalytic subunit
MTGLLWRGAVKLSWTKYAKVSLVVYLALLATGLTIFFHPPFDYEITFDESTNGGMQTEGRPTSLADVINSDPSEVDNSKLPITRVEDLNTTGLIPEVNVEEYRLRVEGLVDEPLSLSYEQLLSYPTVTEVVLLICPGFFADNAEWTGIPVTTILEDAGIKPEATEVVFKAIEVPSLNNYTGEVNAVVYSKDLPLEDIMGNDGIYLAHTVNGQTLPLEHGHPLRVVAKGIYGSYWVKWLEVIEVR